MANLNVIGGEIRSQPLNENFQNINTELTAHDSATTNVHGIANTANLATKDMMPTGAVLPYAGSSAPTGFLLCDGSAVSRTTYANLFAVIGTTYGAGDGSTTFNLPNFKGRVGVGFDANQTEFNALGKTGGAKTHGHTITNGSGVMVWKDPNGNVGVTSGDDLLGVGISVGTDTTNSSLQPYITVNYIIKY